MMKRQTFLLSGAGAVLAGCAGSVVPSGAPTSSGAQSTAHRSPGARDEGDQLLGSLLLVPYDYAPAEFAACDGAKLPIDSNGALFSLLGTNFGGNGRNDFALPDMRGREPIKGLSYVIATAGMFPGRKFRTAARGIAPLIGQLLLVPYVPAFIPPHGWAACDGQTLDIRGNQALFSVMGNKFGGNGQTTFALPDLRKHLPVKDLTYLIALDGRYPSRA
jgi:microcystin-dependent protein